MGDEAKNVLDNYWNVRMNGKWIDCKPAQDLRSGGPGLMGGGDGASAWAPPKAKGGVSSEPIPSDGSGPNFWEGWGETWDQMGVYAALCGDGTGGVDGGANMFKVIIQKGKGGGGGGKGSGGGMGGMGGMEGGDMMGAMMAQMMAMMGMSMGGGKGFGKTKSSHSAVVDSSTASSPTIFVGGLPHDITEDSLAQHFSQFGVVTKVELKRNEDGRLRGFGFVTFEEKSAAQAVLDNKANNKIGDKWIDCKNSSHAAPPVDVAAMTAMGKVGPPPTGHVLKIRGMPWSATEAEVDKLFEGFMKTGKIALRRGDDGRPAGEGFIEFASNDEALRAFKEKNFAMMGVRYIELAGATADEVSTFLSGPADGGFGAMQGGGNRYAPY